MTAPARVAPEVYAAEESAQLMTAARLSQLVTTHATARTAITLRNPSRVVNPTAAGGMINYHLVDDPAGTYRTEHFGAGDDKLRRVSDIGSTAAGTAIATVLVLES